LIQRLLLAASRTGQGGDAYFVVRDLFGGDDVEVVPSRSLSTHGGTTLRPGTIEIHVRLASIVIKVHGSFDVYPSSLVGECEPLIQLHTTTTETIAVQEICQSDLDKSNNGDSISSTNNAATVVKRSSDDENDNENDNDDGDDDNLRPILIVRERQTDQTGRRILSIRPALYEKIETWNTPS
jgi:hypothetical protein